MKPFRTAACLSQEEPVVAAVWSTAYAVREAYRQQPASTLTVAPWLAIGLTVAGSAQTETGLQLAAGDLFLLPTGAPLGKRVEPPGMATEYLVLQGRLATALEGALAPLTGGGLMVVAQPAPAVRAALMAAVHAGLLKHAQRAWLFLAAVQHLAAQLVAMVTRPDPGDVATCARLAVAADPDRPWTITDLAAACHVSPSTLSHRFRVQTGASVMRWVRRQRLQRAASLLAAGISVVGVAQQMRYSSPYQLSRSFRAVMGVPPSHWRADDGDPVL